MPAIEDDMSTFNLSSELIRFGESAHVIARLQWPVLYTYICVVMRMPQLVWLQRLGSRLRISIDPMVRRDWCYLCCLHHRAQDGVIFRPFCAISSSPHGQ